MYVYNALKFRGCDKKLTWRKQRSFSQESKLGKDEVQEVTSMAGPMMGCGQGIHLRGKWWTLRHWNFRKEGGFAWNSV